MRFYSSIRRGALLSALFALATAAAAAAQSTSLTHPTGPESPVTALLLKRIGEAVDGYRSGGPVWVVAQIRFPNDVAGVFESKDDADALSQRSGARLEVFGPFTTTSDFNGKRLFATQPLMKPLKSAFDILVEAVPLDSVTGVEVVVRTRDGYSHTHEYDPRTLEALFFTMAAVDKLLIPYHSRILGASYAAEEQRQIDSAFVGGRPR